MPEIERELPAPLPASELPLPAGKVASLVWTAMRGVAKAPAQGLADVGGNDEVENVPALWEAVLQAANGQEPTLRQLPPVHARRLLDGMRRSFLESIRSVPQPVDVQEVVRVLDGIERVQQAIERDAIQTFREQTAGPAGINLLVEVAHDLRSPLTSILFLAETLRAGRGRPLEPAQERQLKLIYSAAFHLSSLANDLTELAQGGEQLLEREPVPFAIGDVLASVCDIVQPIAEEKGLEVRIQASHEDRRIGHPAALGRVLLNLVTNALRCTDTGFVEATAHNVSQSHVEFAVRDSGPGVPDEVIASLFTPFEPQRLARSRSFSSSGLGLAICRRLVTAMGGELKVRSAPERGSCFYFAIELPRAPDVSGGPLEVHAPGGCADFQPIDGPPAPGAKAPR